MPYLVAPNFGGHFKKYLVKVDVTKKNFTTVFYC